MSAPRPPHITEVMIAAANLEAAEFERDRLLIACGEAVRQALATGLTHAEIGQAASLPEDEVRRLAGALACGPDPLRDPVSPISLEASPAQRLDSDEQGAFVDLTADAVGGSDASR
jgi:ParB-like chromosome segregation protein Spo0J